MKKLLILNLIIFFSFISYPQIGGISNSKLFAYNAQTIKSQSCVFEPGFCVNYSDRRYGLNGVTSYYEPVWENNMDFDFIYGVFRDLESGFSVNVDVTELKWGVKYNFFSFNKTKLAALGGANFYFDTPFFIEYGLGIATSYQFNKNLTTDFSAQYLNNNKYIFDKLFFDLETGYYIKNFQFFLGINYQTSAVKKYIYDNLFVNPGLSIKNQKKFILKIAFLNSIYGQVTNKTTGFCFSLAVFIN